MVIVLQCQRPLMRAAVQYLELTRIGKVQPFNTTIAPRDFPDRGLAPRDILNLSLTYDAECEPQVDQATFPGKDVTISRHAPERTSSDRYRTMAGVEGATRKDQK
jgi:hypothetical protein